MLTNKPVSGLDLVNPQTIVFGCADPLGFLNHIREPEPVCYERPYQSQTDPDNMAPVILGALNTLHHNNEAIRRGV